MWQQLIETSLLEWLAVGLGVLEVLYAKANNILLYPIGIAATALSIALLYSVGLYAESLLNGYYVVMSGYGWYFWIRKKSQPPVPITRCNVKDWKIILSISIGGFFILSFLLQKFTTSDVPYWDAWVSGTAWAGMWLLARRKIENWILLNISNAFAIPLLFHKQLPMFAALTIFLFVIAIFGYIQWPSIIIKNKTNSGNCAISQLIMMKHPAEFIDTALVAST